MLGPSRIAAIGVLLAAGCFAREPEPRGPRVVCSGVVVPAGAAYAASSECEQVPADRCFDDDSDECADEAAARAEHNRAAVHREHVALWTLLAIAVGVVVIVAVTN